MPYHFGLRRAIRHRITRWRADMDTPDAKAVKWIEAALAELAEGGMERVRVEVVAERLGITKGAFYRRFKDRRALLEAMLERWSRGRIASVQGHGARASGTPREFVESMIKIYSGPVNAEGMAIELAVRQWARSDASAGA